ncbi:hypothetical protein [Fibrobacter sp. UBA4309]|uniref:hypothetical protein n=1 Tax=Fibrobacter sp. UBA4309 TaxID=1946537 RepID=UPI0025C2D395|nr:hypothetical protein [Fibrobacter sp. UBA4309]
MPSELAIIERAEIYLRKLSCGVNPLTDELLPEGDSCKQERISKCLAYVASLLQQQLNHNQVAEPAAKEQAKEKPKSAAKKIQEPLSIGSEALARYRLFDYPVSISHIVRNINDLIPRNAKMNHLLYADVANFLVQEGILSRQAAGDGKEANLPTPLGESYGFEKTEADLRGHHNIFTQCWQKAQQYILDNIQKCIDIANERFAKKNERAASGSADGAETESEKPARKEREKFHLTAEQLANYPTDETPVPVSEIARRLNDLIAPEANMERIYYKVIRDWYAEEGYLEKKNLADGKVAFLPTAKGDGAGLLVESRTGWDGNLFDVVVYESKAQKLYLDHLKDA